MKSSTEAVSVRVGRRRQKGLFADRSGIWNREESEMTRRLEPVELPAAMLGYGAGVCQLQAAGQTYPGVCFFMAKNSV